MTDDLNPFDGAVSCGAIYAAVYQECGADGLRYMLDGMLAGSFNDIEGQPFTVSRESLERDAEELRAIGLPHVAALVMEAAGKAVPARILDCPFDPADTYNCSIEMPGHSAFQERVRQVRLQVSVVRTELPEKRGAMITIKQNSMFVAATNRKRISRK
jgi:hypothetical protein